MVELEIKGSLDTVRRVVAAVKGGGRKQRKALDLVYNCEKGLLGEVV